MLQISFNQVLHIVDAYIWPKVCLISRTHSSNSVLSAVAACNPMSPCGLSMSFECQIIYEISYHGVPKAAPSLRIYHTREETIRQFSQTNFFFPVSLLSFLAFSMFQYLPKSHFHSARHPRIDKYKFSKRCKYSLSGLRFNLAANLKTPAKSQCLRKRSSIFKISCLKISH